MTRLRTSRSQHHLLPLVQSAYRAAANFDLWPVFLEQYRQVMHGSCVTFMFLDNTSRDSTVSAVAGPVGVEAMRGYNAHWGRLNPHVRCGLPYRPGDITFSQLRFPVETLIKTDYYNDYCHRLDLGAVMGACLLERDGRYAHIACLRALRNGLFGREEKALLRPLMPHLQRAVLIHDRLSGLRLDGSADAGALDRLRTGLLVMSTKGRAVLMNAAAERILNARDGLSLGADGLRASSTKETRDLRALMSGAALGERRESPDAGGVMRISRPSMRRPLSVIVAPTSLPLSYPEVPADAITLLVCDPDEVCHVPRLLASHYRFTPTEARLAEQLLHGEPLKSAADLLGITQETARTHVKAVMRKTGTHRQGAFVRAMARSLAGRLLSGDGARQ